MVGEQSLSDAEQKEIDEKILKEPRYLREVLNMSNPDKEHCSILYLINYLLGFMGFAQSLEISEHIKNCQECKSKYESIKRYLYNKSVELTKRFIELHNNSSDILSIYEKLIEEKLKEYGFSSKE